MRKLIIFYLIFTGLASFGQSITFNNWEKRILSNASFEKVRNSIKHDKFKAFYDKKKIPESLIDTLRHWNKEFSLANPNEEYEATDFISDPELPTRQIILILKSKKNIFISYKHGGIGFHHHILWAEFKGKRVTDIWIGVTFKDLDTQNKIKKVLSENPKKLNTGLVCF